VKSTYIERLREAIPDTKWIACRTRYGNKVHIGSIGGSATFCGVWLRADASHYQVDEKRSPVTCRSCGEQEGG
jgi:hypothetical protein